MEQRAGLITAANLTVVYIALLVMLGGGGMASPLAELACQVLALLFLAAWLVLRRGHLPAGGRRLWIVLGLVAAIPLLQLVPLPAFIWQALPGRDLLYESLLLVGAAEAAHPYSLAPLATLDGVLSLVPPFVLMTMIASLDAAGRLLAVRTIAVMGLASVAVGAAQIAAGPDSFLHFYGYDANAFLVGFQGNRNAEADVLLIGLLALLAGWGDWAAASRSGLAVIVAFSLTLVTATVLTGSRTGLALIPLALAWIWPLWRRTRNGTDRRAAAGRRPWLALGLVGTGLVGAALASQTRMVERVVARFDLLSGEFRPEIWRDSLYAIGQYWPFGSGLGTFTRVILPAERLEIIDNTLTNRAHNEYLELLIEGGLPLAASWLFAAVIIQRALRSAFAKDSPVPLGQAVFAGGTLSIVLLHSLVDYPFRSVALASLIGAAVAFVLVEPARARSGQHGISG